MRAVKSIVVARLLPVADNATAAGHASNRRVKPTILPATT